MLLSSYHNCNENVENESSEIRKRFSYNDELTAEILDTDLKKSVVVDLVSDTTESYNNILLCWVKQGLNEISMINEHLSFSIIINFFTIF